MSLFFKLGQVATIVTGQSPDGHSYNTAKTGLPFFQGKTEFGLVYPTPVKWCSAPKKTAEAGDILLSVRAPVGPTNIASELCCIGRGLAAIRPKPDIVDKDYLLLFLKYAEPKLVEKGQGSTFQAINSADVANLKVWTPKIDKQQLVARHLNFQLAAVEEARQAAQAQLRDLKTLAIRLNEETITKLNSFKSVTLGELLKGIETGKSFQTSERIASVNELGVLKVSAISWGAFNPHAAKAIDGTYTPDEKHRVCAGDVIITRANTVELVGAVVRVEHDYPNRLLSDKTLRLLLDTNRCDADYIVQVLRLPEARAHLEGNATGSSNSMRNISQGTLRATPIPLPPLHEQQQFSKNMLEVENALNGMRTTIQQQLRDIELLPSRLLAAAFDTPATPSDDE